jgi:cytochrome oxidase Cu insertion factor (SCO1/SenC/PrrC family)
MQRRLPDHRQPDRGCGPRTGAARRVQIVAIDTNPIFHRVEDVQAFTRSHGLGDLPNWHFLAGPPTQLDDALAAYGIVVQVPAVGMIAHGEGIYFISPDGTTAAYLGDGANQQLSQGYSTLIEQEIRRLLA